MTNSESSAETKKQKTKAPAKPKKPAKAKRDATSAPEVLTLDYELATLPSSQHRAGLAGLVMVVRWMDRLPHGKAGILELTRVDSHGATLRIDKQGLASLLDEIYAAASEEKEESALRKKKNKQTIPPIREGVRQETDSKTGKTKEKKFYVYPVVVPRGSFLADYDQIAEGKSGLWIKLFRDMLWSILRGVPATRRPFEARAENEPSNESDVMWTELVAGSEVELPSTYFLGAQSATAEDVPFSDRARTRFLLQFWPFVAWLYCPEVFDRDGKREFQGYAIAIPDIADLTAFCEELPETLRKRGIEKAGYRPKEAIVDLAIEGGLDLLRRLSDQIQTRESRRSTADLVLGIDIIHMQKDGNNIRLLGSARVEPSLVMVDEYTRIRGAYRDGLFRRQRLTNFVSRRRWHSGFDALFRSKPTERTIESIFFKADAREAFERVEVSVTNSEAEDNSSTEKQVYRLVGNYIARKVENKHQLKWEQVKDSPQRKQDYEQARARVAKEAFFAIRSRTGADFVDYFTSTLCSVPQHIGETGYLLLTRALLTEPEVVRSLTLLALSARG